MHNSIPGLHYVLQLLASVVASVVVIFGLATAESVITGRPISPSDRVDEEQVCVGPAVAPDSHLARHEDGRRPAGPLACTINGGACLDPDATASAGRGPAPSGLAPPRMTIADFSPPAPSAAGLPQADPIPVRFSVDPQFAIAGDHDGDGAGNRGGGPREMPVVAFLPGPGFHGGGNPPGGGNGNGTEDNGGNPAPAGGSGGGSGGGNGGGGGGPGHKEKSAGASNGGDDEDDAPTQLQRLAAAPEAANEVPDPASAALLTLVLGALALRRRR